MRTKPTWLLAIALSFLMAGCSSNFGQSAGPCALEEAPAECNVACAIDSECSSGFHCGEDKTCTAECTLTGGECGDGFTCDGKGQCQAGDPADPECPQIKVSLTAVKPTVQLLVDQSISMNDPFSGTTRWNAVRQALVGQNGVVTQLHQRVVFGATLYTSRNGFSSGQPCPLLQNVAPTTDNSLGAITTLFQNNSPIDDTPTAESVTAVANAFPQASGPRILVLATDGLPDRCDDPDAHGVPLTAQRTEQAVQGAFQKGIETYVLAVGPGVTPDHLQRLANAGRGSDLSMGMEPYFVANNQAELTTAFDSIIRGARACTFRLDSEVEDATKGTVSLNGMPLTLGTDWSLRDSTTLELLGAACNTFLNEETVDLEAEFACGGLIIVK